MKKKLTLLYSLLLALSLILSGCQGEVGPAGTPGTNGTPGSTGATGASGSTGATGATGTTALTSDPFQAGNFHGFSNSNLAKINNTASVNNGKAIVNGPNNPLNPCVTFTNASINGTGNLVVDFEVKKTVGADRVCGTADDGTYTGSILDATIGGSILTPSFIFAQLRPGDALNDPSYWVSYVNGTITKAAAYGDMATGTTANQPSSESHTNSNAARKGTLVDNANQTYTYTTKAVVTSDIVIPATMTNLKSGTFTYNNNVIRVGIQMSGANSATAYRPGAANNATYDLVPAAATVKTRDIVDVQNCNDGCHTTLALHGGGRLDTKLCVMCHNPTAGDPESGNVIDFKVMVHKIHMGKDLPSVKFDFVGEFAGTYGTDTNPVIEPFLTDANGQLSTVNPSGVIKGKPYRIWGNSNALHDWTEVGFPANPANCQKCHKNPAGKTLADVDNWKSVPSREACGSCHDGINFDTGLGDRVMNPNAKVTPWAKVSDGGGHKGGIQLTNADCKTSCHPATGTQAAQDTDPAPIPAMHGDFTVSGWSKAKFNVVIDTLSLTAPTNGQFYDTATGETPKLTIKLTDATTGAFINATSLTSARYSAMNLYVSGPRALRKPVLTTAAAVHKQYTDSLSTAGNNLRTNNTTDTKIARFDDRIEYQLSSTKGLTAGTYVVFLYGGKTMSSTVDSDKSMAAKLITFQVGTATTEKKIADGCKDCHDYTVWHDNTRNGVPGNHPAPFDPDYCGNCHDYDNTQIAKYGVKTDGTSTVWKGGKGTVSGVSYNATNLGFGAAPIARRVHGVHNGGTLRKTGVKMLNYPYEIYNGHNVSIVFPQDVRNCEKCHPDGTTSGTWKTNSNRVACLSCHDSSSADSHAKTNTFDPTPIAYTPVANFAGYTQFRGGVQYLNGPFGGDEGEACKVCHSPNP